MPTEQQSDRPFRIQAQAAFPRIPRIPLQIAPRRGKGADRRIGMPKPFPRNGNRFRNRRGIRQRVQKTEQIAEILRAAIGQIAISRLCRFDGYRGQRPRSRIVADADHRYRLPYQADAFIKLIPQRVRCPKHEKRCGGTHDFKAALHAVRILQHTGRQDAHRGHPRARGCGHQ